MIISHKQRFVMLLPWKTASQTLRLRLKPYDESPYSPFFYFNSHLNRVVHQHVTCADFMGLPESKLGYLLSVFVRNPYDRVMSGFVQLQSDIRDQPTRSYPEPWIGDLVREQLAANFSQLCKARFEFDAWLELVNDAQIFEAGRNTNFPLHPVHYWTHVAGKQEAQFIGRVENFEVDFQKLLSQVGINDALESANSNINDLVGDSKSNEHGYRYASRMAPRSRGRINELFRRDFELFGYKMFAG